MKNYIIIFKLIITTIYFATDFILKYLFFGKDYFFPISRKWAKKILKNANVKLIIIGVENIDENAKYIFVANHSSLMDIPALLSCIKNNCRIIYKKELEKIPIFGNALKRSTFIGIQRDNASNAMESIKNAIETIKAGDSVIIFPEGTRSVDGNLNEFKRGAMMLAIKSNKPIVPVTIIGANKVLPYKSKIFNSGEIKIIIGEPIYLKENMNKLDEKLILSNIRLEIENNLKDNK